MSSNLNTITEKQSWEIGYYRENAVESKGRLFRQDIIIADAISMTDDGTLVLWHVENLEADKKMAVAFYQNWCYVTAVKRQAKCRT